MNGIGRLYYRNMPRRAPKNLFVNSSWLRVTANAIAIGGCAAEALLEGRKLLDERRKIGSLASVVEQSKAKISTIDGLIKEHFDRSVLAGDPKTNGLRIQENVVLKDIRNCCADDLEEAYRRAKAVRASRYFQYLWVATSNFAGGAGTLANFSNWLRLVNGFQIEP